MALTLVGGAFLSSFLNVLFDKLATREVLEFFKGRNLDAGLLEKLKIQIITVNGVLDHAEEMQMSNDAVKMWLDSLRDAVYEADDLVDEIAYEALRFKMDAGSQTTIKAQVWNLFHARDPLTEGVSTKFNEILDKLEYLINQQRPLQLCMREGLGEKPSSLKIPTTSVVDEFGFYGRNKDMDDLMKLVLSKDLNDNNLGVIPIVGLGGMGKTTLAQQVYNDTKVKDCFQLRIWFCVSEEFDVLKITRGILRKVGSSCDSEADLDELQVKLMDKLKENKFLLVLDDVWNDSNVKWENLQKPLMAGAQGSKIIVTTRNLDVASIMSTIPTYLHLDRLNEDSCLCLLAKRALNVDNFSAYPDLEGIAREIARKCGYLPLAVKSVGGILRRKTSVEEWAKILESNAWISSKDGVLPALRLSYHYLPSNLKRCFAFCALLPKDYEFSKEQVVTLWIAEGLLGQFKEYNELMKTGDECFEDLVSKSLFQKSVYFGDRFIMHDLINDLAAAVSGEFCFRLEQGNMHKITEKTRHLSYGNISHDGSGNLMAVNQATNLRTCSHLSAFEWSTNNDIDSEAVDNLLSALIRLRVLSLPGCSKLFVLSDKIGNLKHLRHLDLTRARISQLPDTVTSLYNLQHLILNGCVELVELPTNIVKLVKLCRLEINHTMKLREMPPLMGNLTKLQILTDYIVGKQTGCGIEELGKLHDLRWKLRIRKLENVVNRKDASQANLKSKKQLKNLVLLWGSHTADDSSIERDILEQLEPHTSVEYLEIKGYGGTRFPSWVGDSCFTNIAILMLVGGEYCSSLPPVGQLRSLEDLQIRDFKQVSSIGREFYGMSAEKPFRSLKNLLFENMPEWREWFHDEDDDDVVVFPSLQRLQIINCPKLTHALPSHLPCLTILYIKKCNNLPVTLPKAPAIHKIVNKETFGLFQGNPRNHNVELEKGHLRVYRWDYPDSLQTGIEHMSNLLTPLKEIELKFCGSLKFFPLELFPELKSLKIENCPNFESLCGASEEHLCQLTFLDFLTLRSCPKFRSFPKGGLPAPNLTSLFLERLNLLESLPECMCSKLESLKELEIIECPELFSLMDLPSKLESLQISGCGKLFARREYWNLQILPSLSHFTFGRIGHVESFPEEGLLPTALTTLVIYFLSNLKSLNYKGLQCLTSLKELRIICCDNLESLPEEGLPASLCSLIISLCPTLITRCQQDIGEEWPKISFIPDIQFDPWRNRQRSSSYSGARTLFPQQN